MAIRRYHKKIVGQHPANIVTEICNPTDPISDSQEVVLSPPPPLNTANEAEPIWFH